VTSALLYLANQAAAESTRPHQIVEAELAHINIHDDLEGVDLGSEWLSETVTVDGVTRLARTRHLMEACATVIDLPDVAVVINSPAGEAQRDRRLIDVRTSLDRYST
jgi:hypothetical protein